MRTQIDASNPIHALASSYSTVSSEATLRRMLKQTMGMSLPEDRSAREKINDLLMRCYPGELTVRAAFTLEVLFQVPSTKDSTLIAAYELPIGTSRADLVTIGPEGSYGFEFKTDLDSFARLRGQLADFADFFDGTYIVLSESRLGSIPQYVPETCGIYAYRQDLDGLWHFRLVRPAMRTHTTSPSRQLKAMPKAALLRISRLGATASREDLQHNLLVAYDRGEINAFYRAYLVSRYEPRWSFLTTNHDGILPIDYEWFYHNNLDPSIIYPPAPHECGGAYHA